VPFFLPEKERYNRLEIKNKATAKMLKTMMTWMFISEGIEPQR